MHPSKISSRAAPVISFVYLSAKCLFYELYGINCRPKFDTKLLDRFFHRWRQVSPPVYSLRHRFLDGSQHVFYCNVTIGSRHGAVAHLSRNKTQSRMGPFRLVRAPRNCAELSRRIQLMDAVV